MRSFKAIVALAGFFGLALTGSAVAQHEMPPQFVAYVDYFADIHDAPSYGAILLHTAPRGELVLKMGCSEEDERFCMVAHPLSGKVGYIYVATKPQPTRTFDFSAIGEGRGTMTGNDKLRVGASRNGNWVGEVAGGTRVRIEACQSNFCYLMLGDGRQGWVHDGAIERDRVMVQKPGNVGGVELKRELPGSVKLR